MERRLAAIMLTDMVGYSRLIGLDEEGTIARQKAHREEIIDPKISTHGGRIVKTTGDGLLVEFPSVVDAVKCAVDMQTELVGRDTDVSEDRRIQYRIGINLGDIVIDGDDILGDGVNVAARIEALADPGGICISLAARDQVRDKMDIALEDMGEIEVKNIARPVRVFRVFPGGKVDAATQQPNRQKWLIPVVAGAVILAFVISGGAWWLSLQQPGLEPVPTKEAARLKGEKPSIAILPFANLSDDKEQEYFADGMTDDLITDLSKLSGLIVIARNSVFTYKGKNVKVQDVARDLNVTHVLQGSVRRAAGRLRINAQLIDANTGAHLWSDRFDRDFKEIFKLQDELSGKIVAALKLALTHKDKQALVKPQTEDVKAYDLYLKAEALRLTFEFYNYVPALGLYSGALRRDPNFVSAHLGYARALFHALRHGWTRAYPDTAEKSLGRVRSSLAMVERLEPKHSGAAALRIVIALELGELESGLRIAEAAVSKHQENPKLELRRAQVLEAMGRLERASKAAQRALLLLTRPDPEIMWELAWVFLRLGNIKRAKDLASGVRVAGFYHREMAQLMLIVHVKQGNLTAASEELRKLLGHWPTMSVSWYRGGYQKSRNPNLESYLFAPLAKAGVPKWPHGYAFDETKRVKGDELTALFRPPFKLDGENFIVSGVKDDLLCVRQPDIIPGRPYCTPVYRDAAFIKDESNEYGDLVAPSITSPGYHVFSVRRGSQ